MDKNIRIGVISDTHARNPDELPDALVKALAKCDLIIHAGDIVSMDVIHRLQQLAPVYAVHGNMCRVDAWTELPDRQVIEVAGRRIGVAHGSGGPEDACELVQRLFEGVDVIVFGHTHVPLNEMSNGVLLFNPGRASESYGILEIGDEIRGQIKRNYY